MQHLNVDSELEIVKAVLRWIHHREPDKLEPSRAQQLLGLCLQHIRFLALSATEFSMHVTKSGLLGTDECLALLVNLTSGVMPIPEGLCTINTQREKYVEDEEKCPEKSPGVFPKAQIFYHQAIKASEKVLFRAQNKTKSIIVHTPCDHNVMFQVHQPVMLKGLVFRTQINFTSSSSVSYRENIFISVYQGEQKIAYQAFQGVVPYGPDETFQVKFTDYGKTGKLMPGIWYELRVIYMATGEYRNVWLQNNLQSDNGIALNFAGKTVNDVESPSNIIGVVVKKTAWPLTKLKTDAA
jgi:hypothetical protein